MGLPSKANSESYLNKDAPYYGKPCGMTPCLSPPVENLHA